MEPIEVTEKRKLLGQTIEQLADDLGVPTSVVGEWEAGDRKVPPKHARQIEWFVAVSQRAAALAQSGLPECEWVNRFDKEAPAADLDEEIKRLEAFEAHHSQCPTCRARTAYVEARFPPLPRLQIGAWNRVLASSYDAFDDFRTWRGGAGVVLSVPLLLLLGWALRAAPRSVPFEIITYFVALALAIIVGIGTYKRLRVLHGGAMGRWVARSIAGILAMVGFGAVFTLANFGSTFSDDGVAPGWSAIVLIGVVLGVLYATLWPLASAVSRK
jgi:transcriptional regulator with XRE-family HTH domain